MTKRLVAAGPGPLDPGPGPSLPGPGAAGPVIGSPEPRLFTPSLRPLTPATSVGFDQIDFAREIGHPFDPWQERAVIRAGELLPDGRRRFRIVLVLVARQNGKTEIPVVLSSFWMFRQRVPLILGTSTKLDYAQESWRKLIRLVRRSPTLSKQLADPARWYRRANGEQECWLGDQLDPESRYKIAASNEEGGRSLTVHRLVLDELRQHKDYSAWGAAVPAGNAVDDFQVWALSNAGDDTSVVLNEQRQMALDGIEAGDRDSDLCLLEWSAPEDADPEDPAALGAANPNAGHRVDGRALLAEARRAKRAGGVALTSFRTEYLCQRVRMLNPAIDPDGWRRGAQPAPIPADARRAVALCVDMAPDLQHATLCAAAPVGAGVVRGEVVAAWSGPDCGRRMRHELPKWLERIRPRALGWLPNGPAAAVAADLADRSKRTGVRGPWPPPGVRVEEIRGEVAAVCMGLAELVQSGHFLHGDDPLLNDHVGGAERYARGSAWEFARSGDRHVDAAYALAGAVHLARTAPPGVGRQRIIVARR